jgi:hypothetical protein
MLVLTTTLAYYRVVKYIKFIALVHGLENYKIL